MTQTHLLSIFERSVSFGFAILRQALELAENDQWNNDGRLQFFVTRDGLDS